MILIINKHERLKNYKPVTDMLPEDVVIITTHLTEKEFMEFWEQYGNGVDIDTIKPGFTD